jgi:MFS family permease
LALPPRTQVPVLELLGDRNFLAFWMAGILNIGSRRLELLILSLYVLDATDSAFQLGLIWVFSFIPRTIFSPFTGVIADRFSRKRILQVAQSLNALLTASILLLFLGDLIQPWHVFGAALLRGFTRALEDPSRRASVSDIVGAGRLVNAMSLESISFTAGKMAGPILGGILVGAAGFTEAYVCVLIFQILAVGALSQVWIPAHSTSVAREPIWSGFIAGVRYTLHSPMLIGVMSVTFLMNTVAFPVDQFVPAVGRDHLGVGPVLVGLLVSAEGFGRLAAGGLMVMTRDPKNRGLIFAAASSLILVGLLLFAWSPWYALSFVLLAVSGFGVAIFFIMQSTLFLLEAPQGMRGRIMGNREFFIGIGNPVGALAIGGMASYFNIQWAIAVSASIGLFILLPFILLTPLVRKPSSLPPQVTELH